MSLRLPFKPRTQQVLTDDETKFVKHLCEKHRQWVAHEEAKGPVSESLLRTDYYADCVLFKIEESSR